MFINVYRKGKRNAPVRGTLICCLPNVAQLGTNTATFWYTGRFSSQLSHLARAAVQKFDGYSCKRSSSGEF